MKTVSGFFERPRARLGVKCFLMSRPQLPADDLITRQLLFAWLAGTTSVRAAPTCPTHTHTHTHTHRREMVRLSLLILFPFHFNEWPFHRPEGVENEKCHYFHLKKKKKISLSWLWIKVNHNIERPLMLILAAGLDSRYLWSCSFLWLQTLMTLKSCPWCQQQLMNRNLALVCDASDEDLWQQSRADCTPWCWLQQQSATGTTWNGCPSLWVDNLLLASTNFSHLWSVIGRWCQRRNQWPTHRYIFFPDDPQHYFDRFKPPDKNRSNEGREKVFF